MKTEIIKIDINNIDMQKITRAADLIKKGGLVAFPTETVYGLGADGLNGNAVSGIFKAKRRPADNPLILHISDLRQLNMIAEDIDKKALLLIEKFWPGPLTLVFAKKPVVPDNVTCGLKTVAVRMPSHPVAQKLIEFSDTPIAAPSANLSGRPSTTRSIHVIDDLNNMVDMIIDSGGVKEGLESTVLDVTHDIPVILRPGSISYEDIVSVIGNVSIYDASSKDLSAAPKSPGQKYRHYSPDAKIILIKGKQTNIVEYINSALLQDELMKIKSTAICSNETAELITSNRFNPESSHRTNRELARNLYDWLRYFDKLEMDKVYIEGVREKGLGRALMNRLSKAASEIISV